MSVSTVLLQIKNKYRWPCNKRYRASIERKNNVCRTSDRYVFSTISDSATRVKWISAYYLRFKIFYVALEKSHAIYFVLLQLTFFNLDFYLDII